DNIRGPAGIVVTFGMPLSIVTQVDLDTLDLDSLLTPAAARSAPPTPSSSAPAAVAVEGPSIGLKAKVTKLIWRQETIGGVEIDIATRGNTLRMNDIKVSNLVGERLAVRGPIAHYSSDHPRPAIAFHLQHPPTAPGLQL